MATDLGNYRYVQRICATCTGNESLHLYRRCWHLGQKSEGSDDGRRTIAICECVAFVDSGKVRPQ